MIYESSLYHHGVLGQEWGKRNGPPYPLSKGAHSSSEKKAGWEKSLYGSVDKKRKKKYNNSNGESGFDGAKTLVDALLEKIGSKPVKDCGGGIGKSYDQIDKKMVKRINGNKGEPGRDTNCTYCSVAYILNSMFGINAKAKSAPPDGETFDFIMDSFRGVKIHNVNPYAKDYSHEKAFDKIPKGSTGIICINTTDPNPFIAQNLMGHVMSYEKNKDGKLTIIDGQNNKVYNNPVDSMMDGYKVFGYLDFSSASLKKGAVKNLQKAVEM